MADAFTLILAMLALGQLCGRLGWMSGEAAPALHRFVLLVCLPALVILQVRQLQFDRQLLFLVLVPWAWTVCSVLLVKLAARPLRFSREVEGCLLVMLPLGNTAFLGYPMVQALLGDAAMQPAVVYDQLGSFLILSTWAVTVAASYRGGERPTLRQVAWRVCTFPAFLAFVVALLPLPWPEPALHLLQRLADCLVPIVIFAIGLQLRFRLPAGQKRALAFGLVAKMGLGAGLAWLLAQSFGLAPDLAAVAVLQAAMPVMVTGGALAIEARLAPELAAALVGIGVLLALGWLPLLAAWLR